MPLSSFPRGTMVVRDQHGHHLRTEDCPRAAILQELAFTLPSIRRRPEIVPLDIHGLIAAVLTEIPPAELHSIRFLLMVWGDRSDTPVGRFDVLAALAAWDEPHKQAFAQWVRHPFVIPQSSPTLVAVS